MTSCLHSLDPNVALTFLEKTREKVCALSNRYCICIFSPLQWTCFPYMYYVRQQSAFHITKITKDKSKVKHKIRLSQDGLPS